MSKVLLTIDTETKTILLKVDGQEVSDVNSFSFGMFDQTRYDPETDSYQNIEDVLSVNFSVCREVDGKNTKTDIYYNLSNSEELDDATVKIKSKAVAELKDVPNFIGYKLLNPTIQESIARFFKS